MTNPEGIAIGVQPSLALVIGGVVVVSVVVATLIGAVAVRILRRERD